ncbi:MAG TPA: GAF domain-containing sensor histidine kinase [Terriglobales bacterium]
MSPPAASSSSRAFVQAAEDKGSLQMVVEATRAVLADPSLTSVLPKLLQLARQYIPADAQAVWRHYEHENRWAVLASTGLSEGYQRQFEPAGPTIMDLVAISDIAELPKLVEHRRKLYADEGIRSLIIAPLRLRNGVQGTLVFYFRQPHVFSEQELKLTDTLANLAALAVDTAESYDAPEKEKQRSQFLAEASKLLSSSLDYESTLASVAKVAVPQIADWCAIDLLQEDGTLRRVSVQHVDPAKIAMAHDLMKRYPPHADSNIFLAMKAGVSGFAPEMTDEMLRSEQVDEEHGKLLRSIGMKSAIISPLIAHERTLGTITFVMAESNRRFAQPDVQFVEDLARRAATAVDNARLHRSVEDHRRELQTANDKLEHRVEERTSELRQAATSLRDLSTRLLQIQDEERRRIARELHDSLGQRLIAAKLNIDIAVAGTADSKAREKLVRAQGEVEQSVQEVRTLSHLLHPPLLEEAGLPSALDWYVKGFAERSNIPVELELDPDLGRLSREIETTIFRVVQESLTNIHRHSGSKNASIWILRKGTDVSIEISDSGKGMATDSRLGVGIQGMRERLRQLGGKLQIGSPGVGTRVQAIVPIPADSNSSFNTTASGEVGTARSNAAGEPS